METTHASETASCRCDAAAGNAGDGPVTAAMSVAEVSRRFPSSVEVLKELGVNHCCGAHLPLDVAAASAGLSVEILLERLRWVTGDRA